MSQQLTLAASCCKRQLLWACFALLFCCLVAWSWQWPQLWWQIPLALLLLYPLVGALTKVQPPQQLYWRDDQWHDQQGWRLSTDSKVAANMLWCVWHRHGEVRYQWLFYDQCPAAQWRALCRQVRNQQWCKHP